MHIRGIRNACFSENLACFVFLELPFSDSHFSKRGGYSFHNNIYFLQERINFSLIISDKICHFNSYYWSASQSHDKCNSFIKHLESNLDKATNFTSFLVVVLGDFNANFVKWHSNDKTNFEKLTQ